jgi:hypothetical protein
MLPDFELFVLFGSIVLASRTWSAWYRDAATVNPLQLSLRVRLVLFTAPAICVSLIIATLLKLAAKDVRNDPAYIALYAAFGVLWLGGMTPLFPFLGISPRQDALERQNRGALVAICGALLGATFSFAGANIGDGPGIAAVLFCGILSSGMFLGLWAAAERATSISEAITVERNTGAGIRLGGFLAGLGLLSGWAVAGNWISWSASIQDFARSLWPGVILSAAMILVELLLRPGRRQRTAELSVSIGAAVSYIALASAWVVYRGVDS